MPHNSHFYLFRDAKSLLEEKIIPSLDLQGVVLLRELMIWLEDQYLLFLACNACCLNQKLGSQRRPKDDAIFEALGTTDELTSTIGFAREFVTDKTILHELEQIQCIIQDLQATIATPKSSANEFQIRKTKWNVNHLLDLERWIDAHQENVTPLLNFS